MEEKKLEKANRYHYVIHSLRKIIEDIKSDKQITLETYSNSGLWIPLRTDVPKELNKKLLELFKSELEHYEELFKCL